MSTDRDDVAPLVSELAATLRELQAELPDSTDSPGLLRFTEQYAIPTGIAVLEAQIRALEAVAGAIRLAQGRDEATSRARVGRDVALETVDTAVREVSDAVRGTPTDPEARELLSEARDLRREIRERVDSTHDERDGSASDVDTTNDQTERIEIPVRDAADEAVDVDAELETIRADVEDEASVFDDYSGSNR